MTAPRVAYFSRMFQAVPQLMEVQKYAGGVFVSNRASTLAAAHKLYPRAPMCRYRGWLGRLNAGYRALAGADAIVTGAPGRKVLSKFRAKTCMVFHGTYMFLAKPALEQMRHFDLLCVIGPRMRRTMERYHGELGLNTMESGYLPFGEYPEKSVEINQAVLSRLGLDTGRRTVVYMPWGKPYGSWDVMAERVVLETPPDFNLILRPHPSQGLTARRADREGFRRISALCAQRRNTLLDINTQPLPLLFSLADLMVTDGTSPAEESLFYDAPQLFIQTNVWSGDSIRAYAAKEGMHEADLASYLDLFNCGASFDARQGQPFATAVERALADADGLKGRREAYFNWVFGQRDRLAGQRVHQSLLQLVG